MRVNNRSRLVALGILALLLCSGIVLLATVLPAAAPGDGARHLPVRADHLFGTDRLGRDMFTRTVQGARVSLAVGAIAALAATAVAAVLAALAALGPRWLDNVINWLIDVTIGIPGIVLMIVVSFVAGGGVRGTVLAIAVTHWPQLTRVLRAEVMKVRSTDYVRASRQQGRSRLWVATHHVLPATATQLIVGLVVLFPGAVVHETSLTFLGLGIAPTDPSLGVILSEGMGYLASGHAWLVVAPIAVLVIVALLLDRFGDTLRQLLTPESRQL